MKKITKAMPLLIATPILTGCIISVAIASNYAKNDFQYSSSDTLKNITYKYRFNNSDKIFNNEKTLFDYFLNTLDLKQSSYFGSLNDDRAFLNRELGLINIENFASTSDKIHKAYIKMGSPEDYLTSSISEAQKTYIKSQIKQYVAYDGSIWNSEAAALERNKELISYLNLSLYDLETYYGKFYLNPLSSKDIEFFEMQAINQLSSNSTTNNAFAIKLMTKKENDMTMANSQINQLFNSRKNEWFKNLIEPIFYNSEQVKEIEKQTREKLANVDIPIFWASDKRNSDTSKSVTSLVWKNSQQISSSKNNSWLSSQASLDFLKNGLEEATTIKQSKNPSSGKYYQMFKVGDWYGEGAAPANEKWGSNMSSDPWIGMALRFKTSSNYWVEMKNHNVRPSKLNPTHYLYEWGFYPKFKIESFENNASTEQILNILKENFISKMKLIFSKLELEFTSDELNNLYNKLEQNFRSTINSFTKTMNTIWYREDGGIDYISTFSNIINKILSEPKQYVIDGIISSIIEKISSQQHIITITYNEVPVFKINSNINFDNKIPNYYSLKDIIIDTIKNLNVQTTEIENISQFITIENNKIIYNPNKKIFDGSNYILPSNAIGLDHQLASKEGQASNSNGVYSSLYLFNKEYALTNSITKNVLFLYEKEQNNTYKLKSTKMGRIACLENKEITHTNDKTDSIFWTETDWTAYQNQQSPLPKEYMTLLGNSGEIIGRIPLEKEGNHDEFYFQKLYQQIVSNIDPKISNEYFYVELKNGHYKLIKNNTIQFYSFKYENEVFYFENLNKALYYIYNRIFAPNILKEVYVNEILESNEPLIK